jgi:N-acyl-D-amino-acid deacylase
MTRETYDFVFANGLIADGSGAPLAPGDVAVTGERIAAVGEAGSLAGRTRIDIDGRVIAPGFIDAHTHDDRALLTGPDMLPKLSQGVTTVVAGNCGISLAPLTLPTKYVPPPLNLLGGPEQFTYPTMAGYAAAIARARPAINVAALIGHSALRVTVMEDLDRPAKPDEIARMRLMLREALEAGAIGFSTGLYYPTNEGADMDEVVALAGDVARAGGVYATHMRDESDRIEDSFDETFETARRAAIPVVISHHKCAGPENWGRTVATLARIDAAAKQQEVGLDAYPYVAGSTVLDPKHVDERIRIMVTWSTPHPDMAGRDLSDIAKEWGCTQIEAAVRLDPAGACYFQMREDDVQRVLAYPGTMVGSDGLPHDAHPHPRLWGTFPRVLGHYARDLKLMPLEQAVHKMTGLTASKFRLAGRGFVRAGHYADLVVFDPATVRDRSTFEAPAVPSEGIELVMVNGRIGYREGRATADRAGRFLQRGGTH